MTSRCAVRHIPGTAAQLNCPVHGVYGNHEAKTIPTGAPPPPNGRQKRLRYDSVVDYCLSSDRKNHSDDKQCWECEVRLSRVDLAQRLVPGRLAPSSGLPVKFRGKPQDGYHNVHMDVRELSPRIKVGPDPVAFEGCDIYVDISKRNASTHIIKSIVTDGTTINVSGNSRISMSDCHDINISGSTVIQDVRAAGNVCIDRGLGAAAPARVERLDCYSYVEVNGPCEVRDSKASDGWFLNSDGIKMEISEPGQFVVVQEGIDAELDVTDQSIVMSSDEYEKHYDSDDITLGSTAQSLLEVVGRPRDNSEGLWLSGKNVAAREWLISSGAINKNTERISENDLAIALKFCPNP